MSTNTALLFFSRTAHAEAGCKHLSIHHGKGVNVAITSSLIRNTRQVLKSCKLPIYEINEHQQFGNSFGERLANAIDLVFSDGFSNVVVVGNDCPALTGHMVQAAIKALEINDLVLGPDQRGGVFLVGIRKKIFDKSHFINNSWQSAELFDNLVQNFCKNRICLLPVLSDANNAFDLLFLFRSLFTNNKVKQVLASTMASFTYVYAAYKEAFCSYFHSMFGLRAPPIAIA